MLSVLLRFGLPLLVGFYISWQSLSAFGPTLWPISCFDYGGEEICGTKFVPDRIILRQIAQRTSGQIVTLELAAIFIGAGLCFRLRFYRWRPLIISILLGFGIALLSATVALRQFDPRPVILDLIQKYDGRLVDLSSVPNEGTNDSEVYVRSSMHSSIMMLFPNPKCATDFAYEANHLHGVTPLTYITTSHERALRQLQEEDRLEKDYNFREHVCESVEPEVLSR